MKTNQRMKVSIGDYVQEIDHLTMMGNLNALWDYGNGLRSAKGLPPLRLDHYMARGDTVEFLLALERRYNPQFSGIIKTDCYGVQKLSEGHWTHLKTKRGKGGGTWAHLYVLMDAAAQLDADFKLMLYESFVTNRILQWRDDGGDLFIGLNAAIDAYLPGREGKPNQGIFITVAKLLKAKLEVEEWNTASYNQLQKRSDVEKQLMGYLKMGLVRDWEHLKEIIGKLQ